MTKASSTTTIASAPASTSAATVATLVALFTPPSARVKAAAKGISNNLRLRWALQDCITWQTKHPLAYAALEQIWAKHFDGLMIDYCPADETGKRHAPNTSEWDCTAPGYTLALDEMKFLKDAWKVSQGKTPPAAPATPAPVKPAAPKAPALK